MLKDVAAAFVGQGELSERQGAVLVAGAGLVFSFTAILFRGVEEATDWQFLFYRGLSTAVALLVLVWVRRRGRPVRFADMGPSTVVASVLLASLSMLYILALARTTAAVTLFMLAAAPVSAAIFGWLLLRERVEQATAVAIVIAGAGVATMVGAGLEAGSAVGLLLAGLMPVLLGLYNVLIRRSRHVDPVVPALLSGVFLAVAAGGVALSETGVAVRPLDAVFACLSGGIALGVGLPMFNLGHRSVPAAKVSLLLMTEIVAAPLWVWIWPGETPGIGTLVGGAIVIGAVVWLLLQAPERIPMVEGDEAPAASTVLGRVEP